MMLKHKRSMFDEIVGEVHCARASCTSTSKAEHTREVVPGKEQEPLMLVPEGLSLALLLQGLHSRHRPGSFLKGSVSCIDVTQHQLYVANNRPDMWIISPLSE